MLRSLLLELPYDNRGLFANHFLRDRLPELPQWRRTEGMAETFEAIAALYGQHEATLSDATNESQTERDFIRPVLDLLWAGDCYDVQVSLPNLGANARQPDYALFRTADERVAAEPRKGSLEYWADVACVGDAKRWSASLDRVRGEENPSAQVANYLYRSRVRWGILTNGQRWRLYEREKASAGGVYYEMNLLTLLAKGRLDDFIWFYHFFRRQSFVPGADGRSFVDMVFDESVTYAADVGERLKDSVYDALRLLMTGFIEHRPNRLDRHDPATLKLVHDNALVVLYRLLFLLYAEDRGLLPCDTQPYKIYSLRDLQLRINAYLREAVHYQPFGTGLWCRLMDTFRLIDQGWPEAGLPEYNGGLFSVEHFPHLAHTRLNGCPRWDVPDSVLAPVIDLLAYVRRPGARAGHSDIDYATLAVQHLGSIYEGLLELKPQLAVEPLVEVVRGGKSTFEPAAEVPRPAPHARRIATDGVYLVTDRGERKATGSFYTPKYIVDYMVENTIGPLVEEASRAVQALRAEVQERVAELERQRSSLERSALETHRREAAQIADRVEVEHARLLEPYLSLTVLDPAMGSGHFLVGAADYLSLAMATDPNLPVLSAMGDEEPQRFYKRLVAERCLYGVDLNPLAVELAKLSLWLHTVSSGRALSFLDHHLRCGNSLVGARLGEDLATEPPRLHRGKVVREDGEQMTFAFTETLRARHLQYLLDTFQRIADAPAGDADAERAKAHWYAEMDAVRDRFRQVANLWLAPCFGLEVTAEQYGRAVATLRDGEELAGEEWFSAAQGLAGEKRFFGWELEFPEVFLDASGPKSVTERGFDAVIANPPYVRQEQLGADKPYYEARYPVVHHGMADLFVYFFGAGLELVRPGRRLSYISSNSWLQTNYAEPLRRHVRVQNTVEHLVDLGNNRTFAEAPDVCPSIFVIHRQAPGEETRFECVVFERGEEPRLDTATVRRKKFTVAQADQPDAGWQLTDDATRALVAKLLSTGRPLGEVVGGRMLYGIKTGLNEAFIIDQATRDRLVAEDAVSQEVLKPLVRGEDLRPWYQEEEGRWLVRVPAGWTRAECARPGGSPGDAAAGRRGTPPACPSGVGEQPPRPADGHAGGVPLREEAAWEVFSGLYPAVAGWLAPFADRARKRQDKGDYWWELRPCVYYEAFEQPNIVWPDIGKIPRFSMAQPGVHSSNTTYLAATASQDLLAVLQSRAAWLMVSSVCLHNKFREGLWEYRLFAQFLSKLRIADCGTADAEALAVGARSVGESARDRYSLHRSVRHRLQADLAPPGSALSDRLTAWWDLDFAGLRRELARCFKHDIPVAERDQWEAWLAAQRAEHERLTGRIVDLETELNERVYRLYDLTRDEIAIVERVTKYRYGEV